MPRDPAYPIGTAPQPATLTPDQRSRCIDHIAATPGLMRLATDDLTDEQLAATYRPGGWTIRQVVHHVPDSHINSYVRFKWALTEDHPTIKAYDEKLWAALPEAATAPIAVSLDLLEALHARWVTTLRMLPAEAFARAFRHPETGGEVTLDDALAHYAWHGRHHAAQIAALRLRSGWPGPDLAPVLDG